MIINPYLTVEKVKWLSIGYLITTLPHFFTLPLWVSAIVLVCVGWRFYLSRIGAAVPSIFVRVLMIITVIALIYVQYGFFLGRDPGVAFLVSMLAFKMLEMKTKRDVLLFLFLNYFVMVTNFLYNQNMLIAVYMFVAVAINTAVLININRLKSKTRLINDFKLSFTLIIQAIPVMVIMFLFFPRVDASLWKIPDDARKGSTGLSDEMEPGDLNQLIKSHKIAFRVSFESTAPAKNKLYWRGPVLSVNQGRKWKAIKSQAIDLLKRRLSGAAYRYTITLEPTGRRYVPALDKPGSAPDHAYLNQEYSIDALKPIESRWSYRLFSRSFDASHLNQLPDRQRYLQLSRGYNPKTYEFVTAMRQHKANNDEFIKSVLIRFKKLNYVYTLNPPRLGKNSVDDFLFNTKKGFCEHYASAFVVMMRMANIPARVVTGFQGGEYNPVGRYYVVRNSDAHAWAEVWIKHKGWVRVDPTAFIAPERIERGIEASLGNESGWSSGRISNSQWVRTLAQYWDSMSNSWNQWVLGYGESLQNKFLKMLGFNNPSWQQMVTLLFSTLVLILLILFAYYQYRKLRKRPKQVDLLYQRFCKKMDKGLVC